MKCHAAYAYTPAIGTRRENLCVVLFRTHLQACIECDRMKYSDARRVGVTTRTERPCVIVQGLLHKYPGAEVTLRRVRA